MRLSSFLMKTLKTVLSKAHNERNCCDIWKSRLNIQRRSRVNVETLSPLRRPGWFARDHRSRAASRTYPADCVIIMPAVIRPASFLPLKILLSINEHFLFSCKSCCHEITATLYLAQTGFIISLPWEWNPYLSLFHTHTNAPIFTCEFSSSVKVSDGENARVRRPHADSF